MAKKPRKPRAATQPVFATPAEAFAAKYPKTAKKMGLPPAPKAPRAVTPKRQAAIDAFTKQFGKPPAASRTIKAIQMDLARAENFRKEFAFMPALTAKSMGAKRIAAPTGVPAAFAVQSPRGPASVSTQAAPGVTPMGRSAMVGRIATAQRVVGRLGVGLGLTMASSVLRKNGLDTAADVAQGGGILMGVRALAPSSPVISISPPTGRSVLKAGGALAAIGLGYAALRWAMPGRASTRPATPEGVRSGRIDAARDAARAASADHGRAAGGGGAAGPTTDGMTAAYQRRNPRGGMTYVREYQTPVKAG